MMNRIVRSKIFRLILTLSLLQLFIDGTVLAHFNNSRIQNVKYIKSDSSFLITYDLEGETNNEYHVKLAVMKKSDPEFCYVPDRVSGDIGDNVSLGAEKRIRWDAIHEYPDCLYDDDVYFSLNTTTEDESSISPWIWVGGAVVVGVGVYLLVNKQKDDVPNEFPQPPGRP